MKVTLDKSSLGYDRLLERVIMLEKILLEYIYQHKKLKKKVEYIEDEVDELTAMECCNCIKNHKCSRNFCIGCDMISQRHVICGAVKICKRSAK